MRLLFEYKTKDNKKISFYLVDDSEGDNNRGWQVDKLIAMVEGEAVGYLKMSYIPRERFERYYPTVLNYLSQIHGWHVLPYEKKDQDYHNFDKADLIETLSLLYRRTVPWSAQEEAIAKMRSLAKHYDRKKMVSLVDNEVEKLMKDRNPEGFREFEEYHVDKPIVDFIRVDEDMQRNHIALALYVEGAKAMKEKGLKLYASKLQQPAAEKAWDKLAKLGYVQKDSRGRYIAI